MKAIQLPDDPAAVIAMVGNTPILLCDLMPKVEAKIKKVLASNPQKVPEDQLHVARVNLIRGHLAQAIQNKMMRESFLIDQVGTEAADKRREADARLSSRARQMFFESELPQLKEQYEVEDLGELDKRLHEKGSSIAARQRDFMDAMLGHLYIRSKVNREPNVSISEIKEYYEVNKKEFERPSRARWEQLSVLHSNFTSKEDAQKAIWEMGREAYFGGNVQAVAKAKSQEPFASSGGLHAWTTKGALASDKLNDQIFSIPLNELSEIIEDADGLHIVRVLEREEAGITPLSKVQDEIRSTIRQGKITESQKAVMETMQDRIPVWSLFPQDTPGAKAMPTRSARRPSPVGPARSIR
ncbi:MAG: peptidylprolyl isomerase [Rubripirellula sp.]